MLFVSDKNIKLISWPKNFRIKSMIDGGQKFNLPALEEKILKFWEENRIFEKTLEKTKRGKKFVFYEGPPTANAAPGIHHAESRVFKDIILRYKTMRGFFVGRKAGWDTHGLPVEIQIEKELGLKTKQDIEKYGIAKFNRRAKESVWRFLEDWKKFTNRIGFWLDMDNPYITYDPLYMESLWRIIKEIWNRGLLYEDFKVVPWCPRCQTSLSTHELGQPGAYKVVKDNSVFVKLKIKQRKDEYLLIWTTTPWTLPANVAVAVNPKIEYTKYKIKSKSGGEFVWSATVPPYEQGEKVDIVERVSGKSLAGIHYEPMFKVPKEYSLGEEPEYQTIPADFVSTEEGTGMVHLAPAFGDEDMNAVKSYYSSDKYPILHTVNFNGTMKKGIIGDGKFVKEADKEIINYLQKQGLLYKTIVYEHDYPHCWRCDTPLLYFAKNSWWIKTTKVKNELLRNNQKINWAPEYIKDGRFGEFLREVRDWAFSRERFWGTPLPVWECRKCGRKEVVGSRNDLSSKSGNSKNKYFLMRHGEATTIVKGIASSALNGSHPLTLKGRIQAEKATKKLKKEKIDFIYSSDFLRTKQTAEIVAKTIGVKKVTFDSRLREINLGVFSERPCREYGQYFKNRLEKFTKNPPGGENLKELRKRVVEFVEDLEKKHSGRNILIISHEYPLWMLGAGVLGLSDEESVALKEKKRDSDFIGLAEVLGANYKNLPRDENREINLHRPYVDDFEIVCSACSDSMKRVPEVVDVWFDSGAMPFAQVHWPFNQKKGEKLQFPADYICEAVDQTRGWFYTLLAVATFLGRSAPYKNVISLGLVLDKNGQKMSKSKGNVVNPWEMIQKYGNDALRWYFFTINSPGDSKKFDEKDLLNKLRGFLMTFWNSFVFFDTYVDKITNYKLQITNPKSALDRWALAKLDVLTREVTKNLDSYDIMIAGRAIEEFAVNDFSQWYLRRSRRRFQHPLSRGELEEAAATAAGILFKLCVLSAPFIPFLSEAIYQELKKKLGLKEQSVHLVLWPKPELRIKKDELRILKDMEVVRNIVAEALKQRAGAGIKVRQPLQKLQITNYKLQKNKEILELIKEEVNVKEIAFGDELKLDMTITSELKEEGIVRDFIRNIQEMRKDLGVKPKEIINCQILGDEGIERIITKWQGFVKKEINARGIKIGGKKIFKIERELDLDGKQIWIGINTA